jgi:ligand-binding sensor domain-containing protein
MGYRFGIVLIWFVLFGSLAARAEQLPIKTYTIADGLARDWVTSIRQDSHGFLWFCTVEGISRFDGYKFTNYGLSEGLPNRVVNDIVETTGGDYFAGTDHGLALFDPQTQVADKPFFTVFPLGIDDIEIYCLLADADGGVWAGTSGGLFHLSRSDNAWQYQRVDPDAGIVIGLLLDSSGVLWATTGGGGFERRFPDGTVEHYGIENGIPKDGVIRLIQDRSGTVWIGTHYGVARLVRDIRPGQMIIDRLYTTSYFLVSLFNESLLQ